MIHKVQIQANAPASYRRSNNLDEICGKGPRSTFDFSSPPRRQSSRFDGTILERSKHVPCIRGSCLLGDRDDLSLRERDIARLQYEPRKQSGSQSKWVSTNLDCIEIKQRDRPSNAFSRGQRSGQLRLGCDNGSVQYRRRFVKESRVKVAIERTPRD